MGGGAGGARVEVVWAVVVWEADAMVRIAGVWRMTKSSGDGCGDSDPESSSDPSESSSEGGSSAVGSGKGTRAA